MCHLCGHGVWDYKQLGQLVVELGLTGSIQRNNAKKLLALYLAKLACSIIQVNDEEMTFLQNDIYHTELIKDLPNLSVYCIVYALFF